MGQVLYINNAEKGEKHLSGEAICSCCSKTWMAVAPVGTSELECPDCKTMKGHFKHEVAPVTDKIWQCKCGSQLFFILKKDIQCCNCGNLSRDPNLLESDDEI